MVELRQRIRFVKDSSRWKPVDYVAIREVREMSTEQHLPGGGYNTALSGAVAEEPRDCVNCRNKAAESSRPVTRLIGLLDPHFKFYFLPPAKNW